jgi:hypothetical protein
MHKVADFTLESDAPGRMDLRPLHGNKPIVDFYCEVRGNPPEGKFIQFRPVKGYAKKGATGAALQTWIVFYFTPRYIAVLWMHSVKTMHDDLKVDGAYTPVTYANQYKSPRVCSE